MPKIVVMLPSNRDLSGFLHLEDGRKRVLAGPFPVSGRATEDSATRHGNPLRKSTLPYGDTPLGSYRVSHILRTGDGTLYASSRYGDHGAIVMEPTSGDAAIADANGRFRFLIHGGDTDSHNLLLATTGALRLSNADMQQLVDAVRTLRNVVCQCVETLPFSESLPIAVAPRYHEPDPPLLPPADTTPFVALMPPKQSRRDFMRGVGISAVTVTTPVFLWNVASESAQAQHGGGSGYCPGGLALSLSPGTITGNESSLATIQNFNTYPVNVTLTSNPPGAVAFDPDPIIVPAAKTYGGTCTAGFNSVTITANSVSLAIPTVVIIASDPEGDKSTATLTVEAPPLIGLSLNPTNVYASTSSTGTLTLGAPSPTGGTVVTLSSPNPALAGVPATATVPAGASTVTFPIAIGQVTSYTSLHLSATLGAVTKTTELVIVPHLPFDFNNDGSNDLVLQNSKTGVMDVWYMNGLKVLAGSTIDIPPPTGWQVVGVGDFDGDGHPDLVLQNPTNGNVVIWYVNGTIVREGSATSVEPAAGFKVVGVGDFNGDGKLDLLFLNPSTNQLVVWYMNGAKVIGGSSITTHPYPNYRVVGVGDFNGDGHPDIVMQNSATNQVVVWYMNGITYSGGGFTSEVPAQGWQVKAVADFNNDGKPDLVFQNVNTNQVVIWFMNGLTVVGGDVITTQPAAPNLLVGPH